MSGLFGISFPLGLLLGTSCFLEKVMDNKGLCHSGPSGILIATSHLEFRT
jgi:hypothetical protein